MQLPSPLGQSPHLAETVATPDATALALQEHSKQIEELRSSLARLQSVLERTERAMRLALPEL